MAIAFIIIGITFGAGAATLALWSGMSIFMGLLAYSLVGSLAALIGVMIIAYLGEDQDDAIQWADSIADDKRAVA